MVDKTAFSASPLALISLLWFWISSKCSMTRSAIRLKISSINTSIFRDDADIAPIVVTTGATDVVPSLIVGSTFSLLSSRKFHVVAAVVVVTLPNILVLTTLVKVVSSCITNLANAQAALTYGGYTSLVYAIGAYDLLKGFTNAGKIYGRSEEAYIFAAVVYFVICFALSWSVKRLQAKIAIVR